MILAVESLNRAILAGVVVALCALIFVLDAQSIYSSMQHDNTFSVHLIRTGKHKDRS